MWCDDDGTYDDALISFIFFLPSVFLSLIPRSEVSVVEAQEEKGKVKEREAAEARKSQEEHRRAGVLALNDGSLFTRMFRGDKDMGVLLQLQGIHPVMTK